MPATNLGKLPPSQSGAGKRLRRGGEPISYRRLAVCLTPADSSVHTVRVACSLAAERHATITVIAAIEVPLEIPLDSIDRAIEAAAHDAVIKAQATADLYGISSDGVILRARDAGESIVAELTLRNADVVLISGDPRRQQQHLVLLAKTTDHILRHTPCRVLLISRRDHDHDTDRRENEPVFRAGRPSDYWPSGHFIDHIGTPDRGH
jgi:nucleotide-binding universal stress UspA family protein